MIPYMFLTGNQYNLEYTTVDLISLFYEQCPFDTMFSETGLPRQSVNTRDVGNVTNNSTTVGCMGISSKIMSTKVSLPAPLWDREDREILGGLFLMHDI